MLMNIPFELEIGSISKQYLTYLWFDVYLLSTRTLGGSSNVTVFSFKNFVPVTVKNRVRVSSRVRV